MDMGTPNLPRTQQVVIAALHPYLRGKAIRELAEAPPTELVSRLERWWKVASRMPTLEQVAELKAEYLAAEGEEFEPSEDLSERMQQTQAELTEEERATMTAEARQRDAEWERDTMAWISSLERLLEDQKRYLAVWRADKAAHATR